MQGLLGQELAAPERLFGNGVVRKEFVPTPVFRFPRHAGDGEQGIDTAICRPFQGGNIDGNNGLANARTLEELRTAERRAVPAFAGRVATTGDNTVVVTTGPWPVEIVQFAIHLNGR